MNLQPKTSILHRDERPSSGITPPLAKVSRGAGESSSELLLTGGNRSNITPSVRSADTTPSRRSYAHAKFSLPVPFSVDRGPYFGSLLWSSCYLQRSYVLHSVWYDASTVGANHRRSRSSVRRISVAIILTKSGEL